MSAGEIAPCKGIVSATWELAHQQTESSGCPVRRMFWSFDPRTGASNWT